VAIGSVERRNRSGGGDMRRYMLAALAVVCACGASVPAPAGSFTGTGQCAGTVSPRATGLLSQFPAGGPGLRAAVAQLVEADPSLVEDVVFAARNARADSDQVYS
jgi:hypothetical protein